MLRRMATRVLAGILFLAVSLPTLGYAHVYLARRLFLDPSWDPTFAQTGVVVIAVLGVSMLLVPLAERKLRRPLVSWVAMPGSLWMGLAFLLLVLVGASDVLLLSIASSPDPDILRLRAVGCLGAALALTGVGLRNALGPPGTRRVEITIEGWPAELDGFRIVQISDVHIGPLLGASFAAEVTRRVLALRPDLVVMTGDLVDGNAELLRDDVAPFADLEAPHGVFFVTGNHDHLSGAAPWIARVEALGLRVLRNACVPIGPADAGFDLLGVDDHASRWIGGGQEDLDAACAGRRSGCPAILLAHDPTTFKAARHRDLDLQISGHTHDGQIWPFRVLVRLVVPWVTGLHRDGRAQLWVSRGTGFWGPPLRLGAPSEISELILHPPR